ncbi:MAG TPA: hypothetical protein VER36_07320, partial [Flavisolibacter sp.]|nr:hypothetical protein [Flavisolibacter sp.]
MSGRASAFWQAMYQISTTVSLLKSQSGLIVQFRDASFLSMTKKRHDKKMDYQSRSYLLVQMAVI